MHVFIWYVFFLKNSQLNTTCIPSIFFFTILCFELTYLSVCKLDFKRKKYHVTYMYHRIYNQKLTVVNEYATEWYRIIWRTNEANRLSYLQPMHLNIQIWILDYISNLDILFSLQILGSFPNIYCILTQFILHTVLQNKIYFNIWTFRWM